MGELMLASFPTQSSALASHSWYEMIEREMNERILKYIKGGLGRNTMAFEAVGIRPHPHCIIHLISPFENLQLIISRYTRHGLELELPTAIGTAIPSLFLDAELWYVTFPFFWEWS